MLYKKFCNYRARRRSANQQQAKYGAKWRPIRSLLAYLAWKIGPAKLQCCVTFFQDLVDRATKGCATDALQLEHFSLTYSIRF